MTVRAPICLVWVSTKKLSASVLMKMKQMRLSFQEKKGSSGTIVFEDSDSRLFDSKVFKENKQISFLCGWLHESKFFGPFFIKTVGKGFPEAGEPVLTCEFQDKSHKMNRKQKRKRHTGTPENILIDIAKSYGMKYDIEKISGVVFNENKPLMQSNLSDAALVKRLAHRYGYNFRIDGNTLVFRKADTELDSVGRQNSVPVLSYRMNDFSLRSFNMKIKYTHKRKRKKTVTPVNNVDIDADNLYLQDVFQTDVDLDTDYEVDQDGEIIIPENEDVDDDGFQDEDVDTDDSEIFEEVDSGPDDYSGDSDPYIDHEDDGSDPSIETESTDEGGSAAPATDDEAELRKDAIKMRADELITGTIVPSPSSVHYYPGMSVILGGIGERLSGKYKITSVDMTFAGTGEGFQQSCSVERRTLVRDYVVYQKIAGADRSARDVGSDRSQPAQLDENEVSGKGDSFIDNVKDTVLGLFT